MTDEVRDTRYEERDAIRLALAPSLLGLALVLGLVSMLSQTIYPFSTDGAFYIEQAQNFLAGRGFGGTPFGLSDLEREVAPSAVFPPGYPMLIALVSLAGLPARTAALAVSWGAWAVAAGVLSFALAPLAGRMIASIAGFCAALSPGAVEFGFLAGADLVFLLFAAASAGSLFRALGERGRAPALLLSGLLAGLAYLTRNAGIALFPAAAITFLAAALTRSWTISQALRRSALWFGGAALLMAPLAVRNVLVFGKIQPYFGTHAPSDFSLLQSFRTYLWSLLLDLTGSRAAAEVAWDARLLVFLGVPGAGILLYGLWRFYQRSDPAMRLRLLWAASYALIGGAMVVVGRARFDWVETDLTRHALQYGWLALALGLLAAREWVPRQKYLSPALLAVAALLLASRAAHFAGLWKAEQAMAAALAPAADYSELNRGLDPRWVLTNALLMKFSRDTAILHEIRRLPDQAVIVSNFGKLLTLEASRPVRDLPLDEVPSEAYLESVKRAAITVSATRPFYWALLPTNRVIRKHGVREWQDAVVATSAGSFAVAARTPTLLLLKYGGA